MELVNTNIEVTSPLAKSGHKVVKSHLASSKHDFEALMSEQLKIPEAEEENSQVSSDVHSDEQEMFQDWQEQFNSYLVSQQYLIHSQFEIQQNPKINILKNIFKQTQIVQMFKKQKSNQILLQVIRKTIIWSILTKVTSNISNNTKNNKDKELTIKYIQKYKT